MSWVMPCAHHQEHTRSQVSLLAIEAALGALESEKAAVFPRDTGEVGETKGRLLTHCLGSTQHSAPFSAGLHDEVTDLIITAAAF